ncbi:hypothetical protein GCM10007304_14790 [Rhodococcoides trifolii]|uniref:Uncharacterized protein n=1 Tax=Rhodococcoides trifolii TaxID=908250 RepID=A0A917FU81_9NOCA|nr:hypothetical protein [Rhodococcus trifolii]GGG01853.1 hypothetical protein GCM10007304_14790 [Rhodococcus trifolii]
MTTKTCDICGKTHNPARCAECGGTLVGGEHGSAITHVEGGGVFAVDPCPPSVYGTDKSTAEQR